MVICQFIFKPGTYDDEFYSLDAQIDKFAKALPGYRGIEIWYSDDRTVKNASYFFELMDDVKALATYPQHLEAKEKVARWYEGYRVVISEVLREYGDGRLPRGAGA